MNNVLFVFLIFPVVFYVVFGLGHLFISINGTSKHLADLNLYEVLILLPFVVIGYLFNLFFGFNYVQAFHKFMLQKPSDLINFKITIEKK